MTYKDMSPEKAKKIQAIRKKYYQEHREELIRYAKTYNHAHQGKRKKVRRKDSGNFYIKWLLVSLRSGGRIGVECNYKDNGPKFKYRREAVESYTPVNFMHLHDDKIWKVATQIIAGERLLTM